MTEDFFTVAAAQRAHRTFSDEAVDDATVVRLLDAAVRAPSAENAQPWEFVVVRDQATRASIGELMARAFDGGGREFSKSRISAELLSDVERGIRGGVAGAPVLVVVCVDVSRAVESTVASSIFPAVQNLLLAATALGLGSALTTIALVYEDQVRDLLALPPQVRPVAVVPIGHPGRKLGPAGREPATGHAHRERFGNRW